MELRKYKLDPRPEFLYTRDGKKIPFDKVWELDEDGYVISSFRMTILDFSKDGKELQ